ncbi:MAG: response regulator [Candidatus Hydrogenedentota bacterium]
MHTPAILVTDDDEFLVQVLSKWFEARGFAVDVAHDGLEAVNKCRERVFDVITMDIEMPKMGGIEATRLIKEFNPAMPVVVLTGYPTRVDLVERCKADKILAKPTPLSALEREVRALLRPTAEPPETD